MKKYFKQTEDKGLIPCTEKEFMENLRKMWIAATPKDLIIYNEEPIIYGTAGQIPNDGLESIFYCPNNED